MCRSCFACVCPRWGNGRVRWTSARRRSSGAAGTGGGGGNNGGGGGGGGGGVGTSLGRRVFGRATGAEATAEKVRWARRGCSGGGDGGGVCPLLKPTGALCPFMSALDDRSRSNPGVPSHCTGGGAILITGRRQQRQQQQKTSPPPPLLPPPPPIQPPPPLPPPPLPLPLLLLPTVNNNAQRRTHA